MPPSSTVTEADPLKLELLAPEVLVEIFSNLSPLDIVSTRRVCRRLYGISKDREIWLCILARYDYPLPSINRTSISTAELERFLLRADITKNVWTGRSTGRPVSIHDINLNPPEYFIGLVGRYLVTKYNSSEEISWRWYMLPDTTDPVFSHTVARGSAVAQVLGWWGMIETGTNTFHVVYGVQEEGTEGRCFLKVESVELEPQSTFRVVAKLNVAVECRFLLDALPGKQSHSEYYCPIIGHGYLVIFPEAWPNPPIHIFRLDTGQVSCYPWQTPPSFPGARPLHGSTYHLTPWHFIQARRCKELSICRLSIAGDKSGTAKETYTVTIPDSIASSVWSLEFFPKSPNLIFILAQASKGDHSDYTCHLLKIDLEADLPGVALKPQLCRTLTLVPPSGTIPTFTIPRSDPCENAVIVPALRRFALTTKIVFEGYHKPQIFCIRLSLDAMPNFGPPEIDEESHTSTVRGRAGSIHTLDAGACQELEVVKLPDLVDLGLATDWGRRSIKWVQCSNILRSSRIVVKAWRSDDCRMFVVDFAEP